MTGDEKRAAHPSAEELLDYFESKLDADRGHGIEEHLAACLDCVALGREVYAFDRVWQWSAAAHGRIEIGEALAAGVRTAAAEARSAPLRRRLERWARDFSGRAEAALAVSMQSSGAAYRAAGRALTGLERPGSEWAFEIEQAAVPVRGPVVPDPSSTVLTTAPRRERETALTPGKRRARVVVQAAERGEIVVRIDEVPRQEPASLILLIAIGGALTVRVAEAARQANADYRIARFTDVTPGEYLVAFEPLEA